MDCLSISYLSTESSHDLYIPRFCFLLSSLVVNSLQFTLRKEREQQWWEISWKVLLIWDLFLFWRVSKQTNMIIQTITTLQVSFLFYLYLFAEVLDPPKKMFSSSNDRGTCVMFLKFTQSHIIFLNVFFSVLVRYCTFSCWKRQDCLFDQGMGNKRKNKSR